MVQINFALKEVNCKIVYYGPGMSGKTTNLEIVHLKAPETHKGELTSIATEGDRTLFFDFMPLDLGTIAGMRTKFQLYTVPGQVYYNSTRKLVLQGVDGVIFVADSQPEKIEENLESLENLRTNLAEYGKKLEEIPIVIQYNKRDLPGVLSVEKLNEKVNPLGLPYFEAVATTGEGVFPTLKALSAMVLESLSKMNRACSAARRRPVSGPVTGPVAAGTEGARPQTTPAARPAAAAARTAPAAARTAPAAAAKARPAAARAGGGKASASPASRGSDTALKTPPREVKVPGFISGSSVQTGRDGGSWKAPDRAAPGAGPRTGEARPANTPARPPRTAAAAAVGPSPQIGRFVPNEKRKLPVSLLVLGGVILLALCVVLYSLKVL
jgi:signal recognition particle receptor subunit beta